jgi:HSP20 family protein
MTLFLNPYQLFSATRPWFDGECECGYRPRADVREHENGFDLAVELPGLDKADVKIAVADGVLTVSGERKVPEGNGFSRVEGEYGPFERSFSLSDVIDTTKIAATMDKGVLHISLPRREETKPREIEVAVH